MIFRTGAARVLAGESDLSLAAQCATLEHLLAAIDAFPRAVVLFPENMVTDLDHLLARIAKRDSWAILIVEAGATSANVRERPVAGVLLRSVEGKDLLAGVRQAALGQTLVPPGKRAQADLPDAVGQRVLQRLTPKEVQILALVAHGAKNKEIAVQLATTEQVIKNYLHSIYDKTGVSDRLELALFTLHHADLAAAAERARQQLMESSRKCLK